MNKKILRIGVPWHHSHDCQTDDLGYGYLYYALARILKPKNVLVVGSGDGFVPICFALGLQANRHGYIHIVEPGYHSKKSWEDIFKVAGRFGAVGIDAQIIRFYKMTNKAFLSFYKERYEWEMDILFIDGAIDKENVEFDFYEIGSLVKKGGYILIHDIDHSENELLGPIYRKELFKYVKESKDYESLSIMGSGGLGLVRKLV